MTLGRRSRWSVLLVAAALGCGGPSETPADPPVDVSDGGAPSDGGRPACRLPTQTLTALTVNSAACTPVLTRFTPADGSTAQGIAPDRRHASSDDPASWVDLDRYYNEDTDYVTYDPARPADLGAGYGDFAAVAGTAREVERIAGFGVSIVGDLGDVVGGRQDGRLQVVPNVRIAGPARPDAPMLATFILPPRWTATPEVPYPIVLTGNGYGVSNNWRLFRDGPLQDVWHPAVQGAVSGRRGVIVAVVNEGGSEASGLQASALENVGRVVDAAAALGGDRRRVILWGGSRGGLTALVWGANPLGLDYGVTAIFARVPFPELGSSCAAPLSLAPSIAHPYMKVFGARGWLHGYASAATPPYRIGDPSDSSLCRRIMGAADTASANAHSGAGQIDALARAHRAGALRFMVLSFGTQDGFQSYAAGLRFDRALARAGVPVTTYVGIGGGHEGAGEGLLERDLLDTVASLTADANVAFAPRAGRRFFVRDAAKGSFAPVQPAYTPFSARLPKREVAGRETAIELAGAEGATYDVALTTRGGAVIQRFQGQLGASEGFAARFATPPVGTYIWSVVTRAPGEPGAGRPVTHVPLTTSDGPPLTLESIAAEVPADATGGVPYVFANAAYAAKDEAFGVDETSFFAP